MYPANLWRTAGQRKLRRSVLESIERRGSGLPPADRGTRVQVLDLPFYDGVVLVRAFDARWPRGVKLYWLSAGERLLPLDGQSAPIHEINVMGVIALTQENVHAYNRFFGHFVRGAEGPFHILSGREDDYWPCDLPAGVQNQLAEAIDACPAAATENEAGNFTLSAVVQYEKQFFKADYLVHRSGMVEMLSDEPLPFVALSLVDAPLAPPEPRRRRERMKAAIERTDRLRELLEKENADNESKPEPVKTPAKTAVKPGREHQRNAAVDGMATAFHAFSQNATPSLARDFFYHCVLACDAIGRDSLPAPIAARMAAGMSELIAHCRADKGVSEPRVRLLKSLSIPDGQKPDLARFKPLLEPMGFALAPDPDAFVASMISAAPHLSPLIRQVADGLRLSRRLGDGRIKLPPLLFVGPAGAGKSWAALALCDALQLPHMTLSVGGGSDNRFFSGTPRGWATATPSAPAELLARTRIANPALIIEELDKAGGSQQNGNLANSLLTALEPGTAKSWLDECLGEPIDISHMNVIATANDAEAIPRPLLNRMTIIRVEQPSAEDVIRQIDAVAADLIASYGGRPPEDGCLSDNDREVLIRRVKREQLGFRDLRRAVLEVLGSPPPHLELVAGGSANAGEGKA